MSKLKSHSAERGDWQRLSFLLCKMRTLRSQGKLAVERSETVIPYDVAGSATRRSPSCVAYLRLDTLALICSHFRRHRLQKRATGTFLLH